MHPPYVTRTLGTSLGLALGGAVLATGIVRCPTAFVFGIPCPSCGTTRAARALLDLDVAGAFRIHPVAPVVLAVLALLALRAVALVWRRGSARGLSEGPAGRFLLNVLLVAAAAEVVVWGLRWFGFFGGPVVV
jgi:Protein of unknown function (DUF2752)